MSTEETAWILERKVEAIKRILDERDKAEVKTFDEEMPEVYEVILVLYEGRWREAFLTDTREDIYFHFKKTSNPIKWFKKWRHMPRNPEGEGATQ